MRGDAFNPARLVGIFGTGRNGSTLLARLLDGSPDLWIHPIDVVYLTVFDDLARRGRVTGRSLRTSTTRPLRHLGDTLPRRELWRLFAGHHSEIEDLFGTRLLRPHEVPPIEPLDEGETTSGEFLPALIESTRRRWTVEAEARLLGFKTSETAYVDDYVDVFPGIRFVHILRHPLTNYASLKRTWSEAKRAPFWGGGEDVLWTFLEARWLPHARALHRLLEKRPEQHVLVRYEDLCADPRGHIERLCAWLEIEPPTEPETQTVLGGQQLRELPPNPSKPGLETPARVVRDMAGAFGYERNVTTREAALIARATGRLAREFGYDDLDDGASSLGLWLRWLPPDRSETANVDSWRRILRWPLEVARRRVYVARRLLRDGKMSA